LTLLPIPVAARFKSAHFLGLRFRIPPEGSKSVFCDCCVLSGRFLWVGLITPPEESYRVWCVWVRSWSLDDEGALPHWGLLHNGKKLLLLKYCNSERSAADHKWTMQYVTVW